MEKSIQDKENAWEKVQKIKKAHGKKYLQTDSTEKPMVI